MHLQFSRSNRPSKRTIILTLAGSILCALSVGNALAQAASDWKAVEDAMGRPGQMQPGNVFKFGLPRKDLHVSLDGVEIKAGLALGSWVAFGKNGPSSMVMGDLVLTEDEVEPVMMKLQQGGIEQSALHNHFVGGVTARDVHAHPGARRSSANGEGHSRCGLADQNTRTRYNCSIAHSLRFGF